MSAEKVIQVALNEVGYLEKKSNSQLDNKTANAGSGNYTKYGAWYSGGSLQGQPWCDMFVSWCAEQAGEAAAVGCYAYVPSHVQFFKGRGQYFARGAKTPQAGDVIFFRDESHVGFVEYVSGGQVHTIEGNTSGGSTLIANGGGVCRKCYALTSSYILGYGRPAYASTVKTGWQKNDIGWWYVHEDGGYITDGWEKINGKWYYFDEEGYMMANKWTVTGGNAYYLGEDGAMVTNRTLKIDAEGRLAPAGAYYNTLAEVPAMYQETLDKLITQGVLKGRGGSGEDLVLDMSEDAVRLLVVLDRGGVFG